MTTSITKFVQEEQKNIIGIHLENETSNFLTNNNYRNNIGRLIQNQLLLPAPTINLSEITPIVETPSVLTPYFSSPFATLYKGDAVSLLALMEANSVDCIVTSPPYYGQRDYEVDGQIGLEEHPKDFINKLVEVFRHAWRVLKPTGSLWVNIGDTYWSGKGKAHSVDLKQKNRRFKRPQDKTGERPWCTPKQLLLIPHRFAIAMQDEGWVVRNDNIWQKPAPTPDPVNDRCALTHEYVFHFVKQRKYYFDAAAVAVPSNGKRKTKTPSSVWVVSTESSHGKKHKAVFPEELVKLPILATCPPEGILLDPFCGSGTALLVALTYGQGRKAIGIDISQAALEEAKTLLNS